MSAASRIRAQSRTATAALATLALLAACAAPLAPGGVSTVDESYSVAAGQWSTGGGIVVAAKLENAGGMIAVCGAWVRTRQSALSHFYNGDVIAAGAVGAGNRRLVQNLSFMQQAPEGSALPGQPARCVITTVPWIEATAPARIRLPRMAFGGDYELYGDPPAIFRQTVF